MQFPNFRMLTVLAVLLLSIPVFAQNKTDREIDIHENVKLVIMTVSSDVPEDMAKQFRLFIPVLEEVFQRTVVYIEWIDDNCLVAVENLYQAEFLTISVAVQLSFQVQGDKLTLPVFETIQIGHKRLFRFDTEVIHILIGY